MKTLACVVLGLITLSPAANGDWSRFRGADGSGVATKGKPPTTWSETKNIFWKKPLPGPGSSSPIVWKDHVYLTCHTGYGLGSGKEGNMEDLKRHLLCFRLSDGELLWKKDVESKLPESRYYKRMEWHGYASQTPVADADGVYCSFGKTGVHAWTHEGKPLWNTTVGDQIHGWGSAASPILFEDTLILNAFTECGDLVALHKKTGKEKWRYSGLKEAWNTPVLVQPEKGKTELAIGVAGKILGIDPSDGAELWSCDSAKWYIVGSPVARDGVVYSLSGKGYEAATAVRAGGRGEVTASHRLWHERKGSNVSSPVLFDGRLYFAHEQGSLMYCLDAKTGKTIYQERLPERFGNVYSSPVVADGKIFLFSRQGGAVVLEAGKEYKVISRNPALDRSPVNACPAVVGDQLLIRSDTFLYCIGSQKG